MKIYSMTATFGKLNHQTLTLQPGLNVIQAPNEWGKSTWCAFLTAMLYGLETRSHSTKTTLSDKERYTPWSGVPMAGRMDLNWNGRDITIERHTKGRSVFGIFRAYETHSGIPVPELTAQNCGQILLGVEKAVFTRSALIRLNDLPVTQDEALRRRLNALVSTGDDSGTSEDLERRLRELKNRCRYHRTGLLPQAEEDLKQTENLLRTLEDLEEQSRKLRQRRSEVETDIAALENHRTALTHAAARENARHLQSAEQQLQEAVQTVREAEIQCAAFPLRDQARQALASLQDLQNRWAQLPMEPIPEDSMAVHPLFRGLTPEAALQKAEEDASRFHILNRWHPLPLILGLLALMCGIAFGFLAPEYRIWAMAVMATGGLSAIGWTIWTLLRRKEANRIAGLYGGRDTDQWIALARDYVNQSVLRMESQARRQAQLSALRTQTRQVCGDRSLSDAYAYWQTVCAQWDTLDSARRVLAQRQETCNALKALPVDAPAPAAPDPLTLSDSQTRQALADASRELRELQHRLGQCQGQMVSIGHRSTLESQRDALSRRIRQLEDTDAALTLALTTLGNARDTLQRRFAPRITKRVQTLVKRLTDGRYDRLVLGPDLSLQATALEEDTLRSALYRSDGTADLLYLALRLAVAGELVPDAPLILDDALLRFDDRRLEQAMDVLQEEAAQRQILLFTCQSRESQIRMQL